MREQTAATRRGRSSVENKPHHHYPLCMEKSLQLYCMYVFKSAYSWSTYSFLWGHCGVTVGSLLSALPTQTLSPAL